MPTTDVALERPMAAARSVARAQTSAVVWMFASTIFLSAFLLFLVQPMIAKMVLPILGGAPSVWNACVVFFQMVLLAGYGYAHGLSRETSVRRQVLMHTALLATPLAVLPFTIERAALPSATGHPVVWLLLLLTMTIGLPFFALSATSSVLQHWFSRSGHPRAHDPYFLYGASNLGSLLALAAYPGGVEPLLTLGDQGRYWSIGYAVFVALAGACGFAVWHRPDGGAAARTIVQAGAPAVARVSARRRARWVMLAFVPSSLMLAVTSYASTDIAAVPLFWIVPLAVYLLTFIAAFGARTTAVRSIAGRAVPVLIVPLAMFMSTGATAPTIMLFTLHLLAFAGIALLCHSTLASDRPGPDALTQFYFWMSFGGMLGGLFNALAAPLLFTAIFEYPLVLAGACFCLPAVTGARPTGRRQIVLAAAPLAVGALSAGILMIGRSLDLRASLLMALFALPAIGAFTLRRRPVGFALSIATMLAAGFLVNSGATVLHAERTFFGVYRVTVDGSAQYHALVNGTTLHGVQARTGDAAREPLSYYHREGPVGQLFAHVPGAVEGGAVAVIGLGVGSLAGYAREHQQWTFYEIDPAVERIARSPYFTHLARCGDRCRVVLGDARLSLGESATASFDFIVLDAFSSDAIPVHLLTREAMAGYLDRLAAGGAIAIHISNAHLELGPMVAALTASHNLVARERYDPNPEQIRQKNASRWVVIARSTADLGAVASDNRWIPLTARPGVAVWTDDFSNILSVLKTR